MFLVFNQLNFVELTLIMVSFWSNKNFFTAIWWVLQHLFAW